MWILLGQWTSSLHLQDCLGHHGSLFIHVTCSYGQWIVMTLVQSCRGHCANMGWWGCCHKPLCATMIKFIAVSSFLTQSQRHSQWVMESTKVSHVPSFGCDIHGQDPKAQLGDFLMENGDNSLWVGVELLTLVEEFKCVLSWCGTGPLQWWGS